MNATYVGTATADITPQRPVELSGFAARQGVFEGVRAPLSVQVFAFGEPAGAGGDARAVSAVLVCADLLWWGPDVVASLRERISTRFGVPAKSVVLHGSHTHSAPYPGLTGSPLIGAGDKRYLAFLEDVVVDVTGTAIGDLEPVRLARGSGGCDIGINRRRANPDGTFGGPDPEGPVDHEVGVVLVETLSGEPKALLVHYTCHPVVTADQQVSPDYPGVLRSRLAELVGGGVVTAFLQGCCGDINPSVLRDDRFRRGGDAELADLGGRLAEAAAAVVDAGLTPVAAGSGVRVRREVVNLPLHTPSLQMLAQHRDHEGIWGDWSRRLLTDPTQIVQEIPLGLSLLELGDGLALLGFDAEMSVAYGHYAKERSAGRILPIGYTDGMIGYVVTAQQLREGGYEPDESYPYIYRPGRLTPAAEGIVKGAIDTVLARPVEGSR